jgi:hypothetical protein
MNSHARRLSLVLFLTACAVMVSAVTVGCAGTSTRTHVLVPAMQLASTGLEADARQGAMTLPIEQQGAAELTIANFFGIIRSGNEDRIRGDAIALWGRVQELVELGIVDKLANNKVSEEAAVLLRGRSIDFDQQLRAFVMRAPGLVN